MASVPSVQNIPQPFRRALDGRWYPMDRCKTCSTVFWRIPSAQTLCVFCENPVLAASGVHVSACIPLKPFPGKSVLSHSCSECRQLFIDEFAPNECPLCHADEPNGLSRSKAPGITAGAPPDANAADKPASPSSDPAVAAATDVLPWSQCRSCQVVLHRLDYRSARGTLGECPVCHVHDGRGTIGPMAHQTCPCCHTVFVHADALSCPICLDAEGLSIILLGSHSSRSAGQVTVQVKDDESKSSFSCSSMAQAFSFMKLLWRIAEKSSKPTFQIQGQLKGCKPAADVPPATSPE